MCIQEDEAHGTLKINYPKQIVFSFEDSETESTFQFKLRKQNAGHEVLTPLQWRVCVRPGCQQMLVFLQGLFC